MLFIKDDAVFIIISIRIILHEPILRWNLSRGFYAKKHDFIKMIQIHIIQTEFCVCLDVEETEVPCDAVRWGASAVN